MRSDVSGPTRSHICLTTPTSPSPAVSRSPLLPPSERWATRDSNPPTGVSLNVRMSSASAGDIIRHVFGVASASQWLLAEVGVVAVVVSPQEHPDGARGALERSRGVFTDAEKAATEADPRLLHERTGLSVVELDALGDLEWVLAPRDADTADMVGCTDAERVDEYVELATRANALREQD